MWRRFFARTISFFILILFIVFDTIARVYQGNHSTEIIIVWFLSVFIAAIFIVGATLGKWVFGIRVKTPQGIYLTL
ncbi:RDD family protein [Candidatus Nitrosacidococcus tergens]|uniref:Uncharacterized protein n=1 Tax=Candidatus Nitrosacidococcus tergens TaxID=553981 RepID=A0A7G1Q7R8_9GAMM|nr:hypothetical protein [Candidatus Nitrosacidococcus tergens]CAB1274530.1 protein of unknown function [Candidatus Nitrosacidococcus tergens]